MMFSFAMHSWHSIDYPLNSFLLMKYSGGDFLEVWQAAQGFSPYRWMTVGSVYFPFAYMPFFIVNNLPLSRVLVIYFSIFIVGILLLNKHFFVARKMLFIQNNQRLHH